MAGFTKTKGKTMNENIIFVNTPHKACSVHNTGLNLWRILQTSKTYKFWYLVPENYEHLISVVRQFSSRIILNNHMPVTLPWLTQDVIRRIAQQGIYQFAFLSHGMGHSGFDAYMIPDTSLSRNGDIWPIGRPLPSVYSGPKTVNKVPTIGSAGFLLPHKQFPVMVSRIIKEFKKAHIRLLIARADLAPYQLPDIAECKRLVSEAGKNITLTIDTDYLPPDQLVNWLAANDLNVYIYSGGSGAPAPAMAPDPALSARRPIAVTKAEPGLKLFHNLNPSVCIEDNTLKTIIKNGIKPLEPLYIRFSDECVLSDIQEVIKYYWHD